MTYRIESPTDIECAVALPASKSISNRVMIVSALADENSNTKKVVNESVFGSLENISDCDDTIAVKTALTQMPYEINIGAAGTAMRFLTAYLAQREGEEHVITGSERMKKRPIKLLVEALRSLGADIEYVGEEGFPPLKIRGKKLNGGFLEIPGNVSSQYISALLMIAPRLEKGLMLRLKGDVISRPYIDLTLAIMQSFGAKAVWHDNDDIEIKPQPYSPTHYATENDWSAASYWYEIAALAYSRQDSDTNCRIALKGLQDNSRQGDSGIRYIFNLLGVKTVFASRDGITDVTLKTSNSRIAKFEYNLVNLPDTAQTLVVACCAMNIPFHLTGLSTLKIKETDRIEALKRELRKVGYVLEDINDSELIWDGTRCEPTGEAIDTYNDHRMAMAFAPLAITLGSIEINNPEVVSKSYPNFWEDLKKAGFMIYEQ